MDRAFSTKKILVTGASGLLGLNFGVQMSARFNFCGVVNSHRLAGVPFQLVEADLAQAGAFERVVEQTRPDWVIHAAALANLDACEKNPALSRRLNAELPGEAAAVCARRALPFLHISTDAVFDGVRGEYSEDDPTNPQSVYAADKLAGEQAVAAAHAQALIARVVFYGWSLSGTRSLAEFFVRNLAAGQAVKGFTDVVFCPLIVDALAETLVEMLEGGLSGIYHVFSRERLSKYRFGANLARKFGYDPALVIPASVTDAGLAAARSPNLTMRVDKLEAALGHAMPGQTEMLDRFFIQYREGYPQRIRSFAEPLAPNPSATA